MFKNLFYTLTQQVGQQPVYGLYSKKMKADYGRGPTGRGQRGWSRHLIGRWRDRKIKAQLKRAEVLSMRLSVPRVGPVNRFIIDKTDV